MKTYTFKKSYEMLEEAKKYVPNGIYGPRSPMFLTYGSYPCFLQRGEGAHIWDVDGNEYIDYMCSFGTNILGINHKGVEAAANKQAEMGNCFTLPSNRWNELAKRLVGLISGMDWTVFGKNGSDATSYSIAVARNHTKKRVVLTANGAYHGAHFWNSHNPAGIPPEYQAFVEHFDYNDLKGLTAKFEEFPGDVAAVMLTPYHHPAMADQVLPDEKFLKGVRDLCDKNGSLLIIDDIRCNFRLHINGSHVYFGVKPDLVTMGKAIANGHPISTALGTSAVKEAAEGVYFSGTHFFSAVPMAAALATIDIIEEEGTIETVAKLGGMLKEGLKSAAEKSGQTIKITGHDAMLFMTFADDPVFEKNRLFCGEAAKRGVFFHPHHNWFLSSAHTEADIEKSVKVAEVAFDIVKNSGK
ncbi:MAG: aminotransferase class III-fold pyridoxal phosphate-dependent enzyme [Deltaproteobacteria bacterium]|uniref:Aminotransferase class III-fold pyridoxal phosphate-dependent enzyme n=1 Tax=Candidatus Zymogenus saltonus TaxID=2844893 RepID=A0A9D8KGF5_9DELT|nr:aminotransferase class III-fold pyridoxal phosphate-dependent enzyme [Candidatus Zymogenus saltonus]